MQAVAAVATTLFSSVGAAVGVTGAASAATGASIISGVIGGISSISAANYQASISSRAAQVEVENARRIREAGALAAKDQDMEAAEQIGQDLARMGASGFSLSSPSFVRRQQKNRLLADRDRDRIAQDAELRAKSADNAATGHALDAKHARKGALFSFLTMGIGAASTAIGGASLASDLAARRVTNRVRTI